MQSGSEQERKREGLDGGIRAIREDRVDWFKNRSDNKVRETEKERTQQNHIRSLFSISGSESNNPIMCSTW